MLDGRSAAVSAGFLLPMLRPEMRLLDVGCGAGAITAGLVAGVAEVVGIDASAAELERARGRVPAGTFVQADAEALPFEDASFDAALAHALLEHLPDPAAALAELRRVLRPGGVLGVASSDWSGAVVEPRTPDVEAALAGHGELRRKAGGDPHLGSRLDRLVRDAGFAAVTVTEERRPDMTYAELGAYVADGLEAAGHPAATAAHRWTGEGVFRQRWVCVTARRESGR
jgi:SAM-dependent methyltransferase